MNIRYLRRSEIDTVRWNQCIDEAVNGMPYAYSWHLDVVCTAWDALVLGDYSAVFPLPWDRRLLGYRQSYNPILSQQLGPMGRQPLSQSTVDAFFDAIPPSFRRLRLHLNTGCPLPRSGAWSVTPRPNFILDLSTSYEQRFAAYSKSLRKRLRKARPRHDWTEGGMSPAELVRLYQQYTGPKVEASARDFTIITRQIEAAIDQGKGKIFQTRCLRGRQGAAGFFLFSHGRVINLFGTSTHLGREEHSMHVLLDGLIAQFAGQPLLLDFEGSAIPSIAYFFQSFGSVQETYHLLEKNDLPGWLNGMLRVRKTWRSLKASIA